MKTPDSARTTRPPAHRSAAAPLLSYYSAGVYESGASAAVAAVQWSWRLLMATGESRYADLIERDHITDKASN